VKLKFKISNNLVTFEFQSKTKGKWFKEYRIIKEPVPHIIINSNKEIHGWYDSSKPNGKRACTAERLMLNPYNGCGWDCSFCYAQCLWGYFRLFLEKKIITVFRDFDQVIRKQLSRLKVASRGYLSPVTDPFQPINKKYNLTENIIETFLDFDLPVEVITKGRISNRAIRLLSEHKYNHSFGQVTILTMNDDLRKQLILNSGASTKTLFENIRKLTDNNLFSVCRIDPIIPYLTDNLQDIAEIIITAKEAGAKHIGVSCLDIPKFIQSKIIDSLEQINPGITEKLIQLYSEKMGVDFHANIRYRRDLFKEIKKICERIGISMATCMEFEIKEGNGTLKYYNLNKDFMTSINCEGKDIPLYKRQSFEKNFAPVNCKGNCLNCNVKILPCNIPELQDARNWKLKDYRRWTKNIRLGNKLENYIKVRS